MSNIAAKKPLVFSIALSRIDRFMRLHFPPLPKVQEDRWVGHPPFRVRLRWAWRLFWNLCPACNSDAPAIDTCWCCKGNREFPLSDATKMKYLERLFWDSADEDVK